MMSYALLRARQQPEIDIRPLIGPLFIGACLTWMLFGTLIVQIYWYNRRFPRDRTALKVLVYSLLFIDLLQTTITTWSTWDFVIENWGDLAALAFPPRTVVTIPLFSSIVGAIVQVFYAWRIWTVGSNRYFRITSVAIVVVAFVQLVMCSIGSIWFAIVDDVTKLHSLRVFFATWLVGSFIADILITCSMLLILNKAKSRARTLTSSTTLHVDSMLDRLIRQTVETGAVTAVCTGVELVLFLSDDMVNIHVAPAYVLGKLYTNCLVAMLNSRNTNSSGWDPSSHSGMSSNAQTTSANQTQPNPPYSRSGTYRMNDLSSGTGKKYNVDASIGGGTFSENRRNTRGYDGMGATAVHIQVARETTTDELRKGHTGGVDTDVSDAHPRVSSETDLESNLSQKGAAVL